MIKRSISVIAAALITVGLAACNANDNDNVDNRVGYNDNRDNDMLNVQNGRDDFIDHNGLLTEDYTNNNNNEPDWDVNLFNENDRNRRIHDDDDLISAYHTSMNSNQYPHTKAVLIQDAKYQFIRIDPGQENTGIIQHRVPQPKAQVPSGQTAVPKAAQPAPEKQTETKAPTGSASQYVQQVIDLTNEQRRKNGLPALKADAKLNSVAQKKSEDMQQNNYFSHTSPTYGSPFDMMRDQGVTYKSAGENIAQGQRTPQEVVNAWMNSEGHRKNILNPNFTHIGVGYEPTGKHWTQMFIQK
ncbi:CAP domain-containing protein [Neobacillus thermocopriae]|uniref:CAP domain-containing protein n=1 Tax=Neobacillus thermocopriae TaxID=1215031 RepID=UPI00376F87D1